LFPMEGLIGEEIDLHPHVVPIVDGGIPPSHLDTITDHIDIPGLIFSIFDLLVWYEHCQDHRVRFHGLLFFIRGDDAEAIVCDLLDVCLGDLNYAPLLQLFHACIARYRRD